MSLFNEEMIFLPIYPPLVLFSAAYIESDLMLPLPVLVNSWDYKGPHSENLWFKQQPDDHVRINIHITRLLKYR